MEIDKFRLIEEVRLRPLLWDFQRIAMQRNPQICGKLWEEVGQILGVNAITCKRAWLKLREQFCNEANRIPLRIAKAKKAGSYTPNKKYYCWAFFDHLRFIASGLSTRAKFDLSFENSSDSDVEIVENNNRDHSKPHCIDSNSIQIESDNDIEIVESDNLNQMQSKKQKYFENYYESDNDLEIVEKDNLDPAQCLKENEFSSKESENTNTITPVDESRSEGTNFKSYVVSISSCVQDTECTTILNAALRTDSIVKGYPELQIECEDSNELPNEASAELSNCSEKSNLPVASNKREYNKLEEFISSPPGANNEKTKHHDPSTCQEKHSTPDLNDEDYSFLHSFLSQTKVMTKVQKREFRVNMKNLLLNIFPASASNNILEKQLLLPEDNDPDRRFLISFWPFIKSMSLKQNVQFRAKMANLVSQLLSSELI